MLEPYNVSPRVYAALCASARRKADVAQQAGIRWAQFQKILNGQRPHVSAETVRGLAQALDVSTDYLLGLTDDPTPHWTRREVTP